MAGQGLGMAGRGEAWLGEAWQGMTGWGCQSILTPLVFYDHYKHHINNPTLYEIFFIFLIKIAGFQ